MGTHGTVKAKKQGRKAGHPPDVHLEKIILSRLVSGSFLIHWFLGVVNFLTGLLTPSLVPFDSIELTV